MYRFLEQEKRLSQSVLWELQKKAYALFGPSSWTEKKVPFQITSSPFIAKQYALIALGYLKNVQKTKEPFYFLELGGGSGKFAYLFLSELLPRLKEASLSSSICYILTDGAEKNVSFWKQHPLFAPYLEQKILKVALYDPLKETPPFISTSQPLFVIANYFFDSIPQDAFRVEGGKLFEGRLSLMGRKDSPFLPEDPNILPELKEEYLYHPVENSGSYYPDFPESAAILDQYVNTLQETSFLFPIGALQAIRNLLDKRPLVILAGDKGVCQLNEGEEPKRNRHATFSFPVNFDAIKKYIEQKGGEAHFPMRSHPEFNVCLFSHGISLQKLPDMLFHYKEQIDCFGPQEAFEHFLLFERSPSSLTQMLLHIQLANWDPSIFFIFFDRIASQLKTATKEEKQNLHHTILRLSKNFFFFSLEEKSVFSYKLNFLLSQLL